MFDAEDDVDDRYRKEALEAIRAERIRTTWEDFDFREVRDYEWWRANVEGQWPKK